MSLSLTYDLYERFKAAVPHYGGRSRVLCLLIKGFLEGKFRIDNFNLTQRS